jgi:hypothetical protein
MVPARVDTKFRDTKFCEISQEKLPSRKLNIISRNFCTI